MKYENIIDSTVDKLNLADYLPFPKEGLNVILENGNSVKLYYVLSETNYVGQYPILGICCDTGQIIQFSLSGRVSNRDYSSIDIASIERTKFPEDMWSVVSTDYNYLAIDEDGRSWFFEKMPQIGYGIVNVGFWFVNGISKQEQNSIIPVSTTNWKLSLIKRP